jgi:hypothetical protein
VKSTFLGVGLIDKTLFLKECEGFQSPEKGEAKKRNFKDYNPGSSPPRMERKIK